MLKINELFSGIGAVRAALQALEVETEVVGISEIDKYAIQSYEAMYGKTRNYGDISKVDKLDYADMWVYGFPCQDISVAGLGRGIIAGETRSGLLYEVQRLLEISCNNGEAPKWLLMENVKNLVGKKFRPQFEEWLSWLESKGYVNYWKVLNAKDYGIPQNRERVFCLSVRKDIDRGYTFPEPIALDMRLKDVLEREVDERYYLSKKMIDYACQTGTKNFYYKPEIDLEIARPLTSTMAKMHRASTDNFVSEGFLKDDIRTEIVDGKPQVIHVGNVNPSGRGQNGSVIDAEGLARTITIEKGEGQKILEPQLKQVCQLYGTETEPNPQAGRVYDAEGISPTMDSCSGGNRMPKVIIPQATSKGYIECNVGGVFDASYPNSKTRRGRVQENGEVTPTITASGHELCYVEEPKVLRPERTEYGKAIRKQYEAGEIEESRHNMTELKPRQDGISNTITTVQKDNILVEPFIVASRGRNPENPSDRTPGIQLEQRLEPNTEGLTNTITTVQKDNYVAEPQIIDDTYANREPRQYSECSPTLRSERAGLKVVEPKPKLVGGIGEINFGKQYRQGNRIYSEDGVAMALQSGPVGNAGGNSYLYKTGYRIRKLIPRECWRLQGFPNRLYDKAEQMVSNTQLYKQAGNSIYTGCLIAILYSLRYRKTEGWDKYLLVKKGEF